MSLFHIRLTFGIYIRYVLRNNKNNQCDRAYLYNNFSALLFKRLCFNVDAITLWTTFIYSSTPAPPPLFSSGESPSPPPPYSNFSSRFPLHSKAAQKAVYLFFSHSISISQNSITIIVMIIESWSNFTTGREYVPKCHV